MPSSKQQPLTAPRGGSAHDFSGRLADWEAACFDDAIYFAVVRLRERDGPDYYRRFSVLPWAIRCAERHADAVVHAVTESGRFALLDREKWGEWETRWWETRDEHERQTREDAAAHDGVSCL